jgi:superfamily II DNA/RNA helicase
VTTTFRDLGVDPALCDALEAKGIVNPFPIQAMTLPMALAGGDLIGQARTGTGKTLAFGLPLLQRLDPSDGRTQALVVVPTRELCVQVHEDLAIGAARGLTTIAVYGGTPYEEQTAALESGVHVVVGTPGRLIDHLNRGTLDLSAVRVLVLDEADEMLDMGFLPDVERLIEACPVDRHTMLFSATMPTAIVRMARRYMVGPTFTRADLAEGETAPNVAQHFLLVHRMDKPRLLARILQAPERGNVYVFVRTKHMADRLVEELADLGAEAIAIHGDLRQATREKNLDRFRAGKVSVLVATEVAARGLDVDNVTHVVNYDCPEDDKMYLHRIGRTARAGRAGVAVTFVEHQEAERANLIRRAIDRIDLEVTPMFSTSPELAALFDVPEEVPWARAVQRRRAPEEESSRGGRGGGRDGGRSTGGRSEGGRGQGGRSEGGRDGGGRRAGGRASDGRDSDGGSNEREDRASGSTGEDRGPRRQRGERGERGSERTTAAVSSTPAGPAEGAESAAGEGRSRSRTRVRSAVSASADRAEVRSAETQSTRRRDEGGRDPGRSTVSAAASDTGGGESEGARRGNGRRRGGRGRGRGGDAAGGSDMARTAPRSEGRTDAPEASKTPKAEGEPSGSRRGGARRSRGGSGGNTGEGRGESARGNGERRERGDGQRSDRADRSEQSGRAGRSEGERSPRERDAARDASAARGEGQPQLVRRVKVEHLP